MTNEQEFDRIVEMATSNSDLDTALAESAKQWRRADNVGLLGALLSFIAAICIGRHTATVLASSSEWDGGVCGFWIGVISFVVLLGLTVFIAAFLEPKDAPSLIQKAKRMRALIAPKSG